MKQSIKRVYYLDVMETKRAIFEYLKSLDRPVPNNVGELTLDCEQQGGVTASFVEQSEIEKPKLAAAR